MKFEDDVSGIRQSESYLAGRDGRVFLFRTCFVILPRGGVRFFFEFRVCSRCVTLAHLNLSISKL